MPIFSSVRRTGKADSSTSRMISSFSEAGYSCGVLPIRRHAFFQQTIFEGQLSYDLLQRAGLASQVLDLVRGRGPGRIASQSLLPGLEKVFRPAIIKVLDDPLAAAELGDAVLAAQAFQYDADLVFRREVSPRRATDLLHHFCRRFFLRHGFLSHLRSREGYDELEILPSSTHPICLMSADGRQWTTKNAAAWSHHLVSASRPSGS